jgi:hypothetical protein
MKLTPPKGDMKVWTILWAIVGASGIYCGIADSSKLTVVVSIIQLAGSVGIWVDFPSAKWLLILFFFAGILGRFSSLVFGHFNPTILYSMLLYVFWLARFIVWKPTVATTSNA